MSGGPTSQPGADEPGAAAQPTGGATREPTIRLRGVERSFGAVEVLRGVDLDLHAGQVTALVGDNGAGKSTLVKGLAGIHPFDAGRYVVRGREVRVAAPTDAARLGIEVVYQDLALCDNLDVVANLHLGRERTGRRWPGRGLLDERAMARTARDTLDALGVRTLASVRTRVSELSGGQRQVVAIARAVLADSQVVVLDEPTAALGVAQTEQVLALVRRLADTGRTVVLVSHNLADVLRVADSVAVLYLGRTAAQAPAGRLGRAEVVQLITTGRATGRTDDLGGGPLGGSPPGSGPLDGASPDGGPSHSGRPQ